MTDNLVIVQIEYIPCWGSAHRKRLLTEGDSLVVFSKSRDLDRITESVDRWAKRWDADLIGYKLLLLGPLPEVEE